MPAVTNFLVFNPDGELMEIDAAYAADTLRTGGIPTAAIVPHLMVNKLFYQLSMFVTAFCQMMVNKGVSTSDANFANLVTALSAVRLTSDFMASIVEIPWATSVVFDGSVSAQFDLLLTGNVAASSLVNTTPGQFLIFIVVQDNTGGRTMVWPSNLNGVGLVCPLANSISVQMFGVRPNGYVFPMSRMLWATAGGLLYSDDAMVVQVSSSGNVLGGYREMTEEVNSNGGNITRTLFTSVGNLGRRVNIQKSDSNIFTTVNVVPQTGQTIDGLSTIGISKPLNALTFLSDGTNWIIV